MKVKFETPYPRHVGAAFTKGREYEVLDVLRSNPSDKDIKAQIGLEAVQDFIAIARSL